MVVSKDEEEEKTKFMEKEDMTIKENELELILNNSLVLGLNNLKTMKFTYNIKGQKMMSLLDSRATYNFISIRLVKELKLPVSLAQFTVTLGMNGG